MPGRKLTARDGAAPTDEPANFATQATVAGPVGPLANARALPYGTIIGRYFVLKQLGEGGMGVVYAAYDPALNRKVAIKLIRDSGKGLHAVARQRLLREAQAMAQLSHPNIIAVFDVGTAFEQVFVAMEFIEGGTLRQWLAEKPRTQREIVAAFVKAGRGLCAAHAAGLVHRDFKPDNVLVSKDGRVLVTDFGLVRSVSAADEDGPSPPAAAAPDLSGAQLHTPLTETGVAVGTPAYMAPEQLISNQADPRSDQYSFCLALYEACYRVAPFAAKAGKERLEQMFNRGPQPPPAQYRLPPRWRRALLRGLAAEPAARFASLEDLLKELSRDRGRRRRRWALAIGGLTMIAVLTFLYVRAQRRSLDSFCAHATDRQPPLWHDGPRRAVHKALLGMDRHFGGALWKHIAPLLDEYGRQWKKMNVESCQATLIRREQTAVVYELRYACLERRHQEFSALTSLLQAPPDKQAAQRAANAIFELTPISACADVVALSAPTPMPDAPQLRERIRELYRSIEELRVFEHTGRYSVVSERARAVVQTAQGIGYAPALAEAQYLLGKVLYNTSAYDTAEQAYIAAAAAAVQGHDSLLAAKSYTALVGLLGTRRRFAGSDTWAALARAELDSGRNNPSTRVRLLLHSCQSATARRQFAAAEAACQQALQLSAAAGFADTPQRATVLRGLANLRFQQDHLGEALDLFAQALSLQERHYAVQHPMVAATLREQAAVLLAQGRAEEAGKAALRSLVIDEQSFGAAHFELTEALQLLATIRLAQGDREQAILYAQRAVDGTRASLPEGHPRIAIAVSALGDVLARAGRLSQALEQHQAALASLEPTSDEVHAAAAALGVAEDLLATGQAAQALPRLEWGFHSRALTEERLLLGRRQFAWARALWAAGPKSQHERAVALAKDAQASFRELGSQARRALAEVDDWLAQNPLL